MTLAFEDANSKLVEVDTVADVDDEDRIGNSLLQIWKLRFGHEFEVEVQARLWSWGLVSILLQMFGWKLKGAGYFHSASQVMEG